MSSVNVGVEAHPGIISEDGTTGIGVTVWNDVTKEANLEYRLGKDGATDVVIGAFYRGINEKDGYHPSHSYLKNPVQAITRKRSILYELLTQFITSFLIIAGFVVLIALFEAFMVAIGLGSGKGFVGYLNIVFRDIFVFLNGEFVSYPKKTADRLRLLFVSVFGIITLATMTASAVHGLLTTRSGMVRSLEDTEGAVYIVQKGSISERIARDLGVRHETTNDSIPDILRGILRGDYPAETEGVIATRIELLRALYEDRSGLGQSFRVSPYVFANTDLVFMIRDGISPRMTRRLNEAIDRIHNSGLAQREAEQYAPGFGT